MKLQIKITWVEHPFGEYHYCGHCDFSSFDILQEPCRSCRSDEHCFDVPRICLTELLDDES